MPGIRDRNLRSGDIHEDMGLTLLRTIALVAPVPRQEDVGADALATLLRHDGNRRLLADLSFLVQLKSQSRKLVSYTTPEDIAWITNLEIPLFIGRVDLNQSRLELFSTQRLHQILLEKAYDGIHLLLDRDSETSEPSARSRRANIGPPVLVWSLKDAIQPDFLVKVHQVLRPHVEHIRYNLLLRKIGYQRLMRWSTNSPPVYTAFMMLSAESNATEGVLKQMEPYVTRLLAENLGKMDSDNLAVLLELVRMMRRYGIDPDPHDAVLRVMAYLRELDSHRKDIR